MLTAKESFVKFIDNAAKAVPADTAIGGLKTEVLKIIDELCGPTVAAAKSAVDEAAVCREPEQVLERVSAAFCRGCPKFTEVTTHMTEAAITRSAALTDETNATARNSLIGVIAGIAIVLGLGFVAIRGWLVRPIRSLSDTMGTLAGGDLSVMSRAQSAATKLV